MRAHEAVYGGEMSAYHYLRDFAYYDSGMVPWLLMVELISTSGKSLGELVADRFRKFSSSGEQNFTVFVPDRVIITDHQNIFQHYLNLTKEFEYG